MVIRYYYDAIRNVRYRKGKLKIWKKKNLIKKNMSSNGQKII